MRVLTTAVIMAACAVTIGAPAYAAGPRLTDSQFVKVARCQGLAASPGLGGDKAAFDSVLKVQRQGRADLIRERADNARADAEHQARVATDASKQALSAELTGACAALLS